MIGTHPVTAFQWQEAWAASNAGFVNFVGKTDLQDQLPCCISHFYMQFWSKFVKQTVQNTIASAFLAAAINLC